MYQTGLFEPKVVTRFMRRVDTNGPTPEHCPELGQCWLWVGSRSYQGGYGRLYVGPVGGSTRRLFVRAHRWSYEFALGRIPEGLTVDHLCRVRHCVRPDHLEPVTRGENVLRGNGRSATAARRTQCDYGHPFTADNTRIERPNKRRCRTCDRLNARLRRERARRGLSA